MEQKINSWWDWNTNKFLNGKEQEKIISISGKNTKLIYKVKFK